MAFRAKDKEEAQALDINQLLMRSSAAGVIDGGDISTGAGSHEVAFQNVSVYIQGTEHQLGATAVDLSSSIPDTNPRKVIIYIDEFGSYQVAEGTAERLQPNDRNSDNWRFESFRPAPPSMHDTIGVPMAEVFLDDGSDFVSTDDIRDRRLDARASYKEVEADTVDVSSIIDGANVGHSGELADLSDVRTDSEIISTINNDPNHATSAEHNYFSGLHADLTDDRTTSTWASAHHTRPDGPEVRNWVEGDVEVDTLLGNNGTNGQGLLSDGTNTYWGDLPETQAPQINSGSVTHTTGGSTTVMIQNVTGDRGTYLHMVFGTDTANNTATGDADWDVEWERRWDSVNGHVDVEVVFTWSNNNDPGTDIPINWAAYEFEPTVVTGKYNDSKVIDAISGQSISPATMSASGKLQGPTFDDLSNYPNPGLGSLASATGNGPDSFGLYVYNGTSWSGPLAAGVSALSGLTIDVAKDWAGNRILNIGTPQNAGDASTKGYVDGQDNALENRVAKARKVFNINGSDDGSGNPVYHKLASLTDLSAGTNGAGQATVVAHDAGNRGGTISREIHLDFNQKGDNFGIDHWVEGIENEALEIVVTRVANSNGTDEFHLYAKVSDFVASKIIIEADAQWFGSFDNGATGTSFLGTKVYGTDTDNPNATIRAGNVVSGGNQVVTNRYTDVEAIGKLASTAFTVNIPATTLEAGKTVETWADFGANGSEMRVIRAEWQDESGFHPDGGYYDVLRDGNVLHSNRYNEYGSYSSPIITLTTGGRIQFRIRNNTGSEMTVSGLMRYTIE